jgi:hypothetical protein
MSPQELTLQIREIREAGWVLCDWRARAHKGAISPEELEAYAETVNLHLLGKDGDQSSGSEGWREITLEEARPLIIHWMRHDLAYSNEARDSDEKQAAAAAAEFFGVFGDTVQLFTNALEADSGPRSLSSWTSRTRHSFDLGVVAADDKTIGLVWFADED